MPGEPNRWYMRFRAYLALGPNRSVEAAFRAEKGRDGPATGRWKTEGRRWRWRERADAHDQAAADGRRRQLEADAAEASARHRRLARLALEKAGAALEGIDPAKLTPAEAVRLLAVASRLESEAIQAPLAEVLRTELDELKALQTGRDRR